MSSIHTKKKKNIDLSELISSQLNKEVSTIDFCSSLNSKEGRSDSENPKLIFKKKIKKKILK